MFTGIVEEVGVVQRLEEGEDIHQYQVQTSAAFMSGVKTGESISVNGVCLTAYNLQEHSFQADVSMETRRCTTFGKPRQGDQVNLERSVTPTTRLGGHIVSGHIDGIVRLIAREDHGNESDLWISVPDELSRYIAPKGSICLDGVSLTINRAEKGQCCVTVIPHTLKNTTLGSRVPEDEMNLEVDLVARYLEQLTRNDR